MMRIGEVELDQVLRTAPRVVATVLLPWRAARLLLKPRVGVFPQDQLLDRLAFWRSALGLLVIVFATSPWQTTSDTLENIFGKTQLTALYAMCTVPLMFLVALIATRSGFRARLLAGTLRLLGRVALAAAGFMVLIGYSLLLDGRNGAQQEFTDESGSGFEMLLALGLIWLMIFILCTIYWAARTGFWLGEAHPLLAPVGTTAVMLVTTARELVTFDTEGVPNTLWLTLNLCGAISALTLAIVEYRHLHSIGYRFRTGPEPVPDSRTSHGGSAESATPSGPS